jgi:molecular chaperone IbpA
MNTRRINTTNLPQFANSAIGFDKLFETLEKQFAATSQSGTYPPYNVVQLDENEYMVSIAVAGFRMEDLDIVREKNILRIEGTAPEQAEGVTYLHKGIAGRSFRRDFTLADYIEVEDATLEYGVLNIKLKRLVPEALQPKRISITQMK